jgi:hypothetical protein
VEDSPIKVPSSLSGILEPTPLPAITGFKRRNHTSAQMLGRIPSMTWRTVHSRSYVSFEIHQRDIVCAAVHYRPSPESHQKVGGAIARGDREAHAKASFG